MQQTKKKKTPTWIDVKKTLKNFENSQLIELLKELYQLSGENKNFFHARFNAGTVARQNYKKIILDCLYEDPMADNDDFDFDKADNAIKTYAKAANDNEGTADLMVYYVECGNKFTLDYGDINEVFYDALIEMYKKAIKTVLKLPKSKQTSLRKRLKQIMESADGIGWGYYDDLCHFYHESFK